MAYRLIPLKVIPTIGGEIQKIIDVDSDFYDGFGELYISSISNDIVRDWKQHSEMLCSLVVTEGEVIFLLQSDKDIQQIRLNSNNPTMLQILPGTWYTFQGVAVKSNILNIANKKHNENEIQRKKNKSEER